MSSQVTALKIPPREPSEREIYLRIFEHSKDSVFLVTPSGNILFANPKAVEDTSYESDELVNLEFKTLFLPEEQPAIATLLDTTVQWNTGIDPQRFLKRKTGRKIIVEIHSSMVELEGQKAIFVNVRDITARVKAEEKIKQYSKELETINAELEDRVKARTQELASANSRLQETNVLILRQKKELDDVMSNIQQAIFTVSSELMINEEHSKFVYEVFGNKPVSGMNVVTFLYGEGQEEGKGKPLKESLELLYLQPETWEMLRNLVPRELRYERPRKDEAPDIRELRLEWCPIFEGQAVAKVMVICLDVTEQKRLEAEIAQKEAQHTEQLELISQLIALPAEVVGQFVSDTKRMLEETKAILGKAQMGIQGEMLNGLMRTMHTIKGSARQFRLNSIQKKAHEIESKIVAAIKERPPENFLDQLVSEFGPLETSLGDVHSFYDKTVGRGAEGSNGGDCISVPIQKIETLLEKIPPGNRPVSSESTRQAIYWLMQVPVKSLFDRIEAVITSLADELAKEVEVVREGEDVQMDFRFAGPLYDAFLHSVRNCMDHGAETPEERREVEKPTAVRITLRASVHKSDFLVFQIIDDGRGIDVEKVKKRALEKGLATEEQLKRLSREQVIQYVFTPGFSTKDSTTLLSGRGIGLDMVREVVERNFGGEVIIESEHGKGTRLTAKIPINAFLKPTGSYLCLLSDPTRRSDLEQRLNIHLREMDSHKKVPGEILITDLREIETVRAKDADFPLKQVVCMDSAEPKDLVEKILTRQDLRHFVDISNPHHERYARSTLKKLDGGTIWGVDTYLWPNTPLSQFTLRDYDEKNAVIDELGAFCGKLRAFSGLADIVATIADEMIMNAMFDAPRDEQGREKYNHLPRTHRLVLEPDEVSTFRFGADPNFIGISIEDPFGALSYVTLVNYLKKCYAARADQIDQKPGGAGLGLFTLFEASHCLVINSDPGRKTEMICLIALSRSYERYQRIRKSLSFFTTENREK